MSSSEKGFTMIELLVAVLILSVGLLGLFQTVYLAIGNGMKDALRAEGVTYGDEVMSREVNQPFANITTGVTNRSVVGRTLTYGMGFSLYSSIVDHVYVSPSTTDIKVRVSWRCKGVQYSHNLATMVSK